MTWLFIDAWLQIPTRESGYPACGNIRTSKSRVMGGRHVIDEKTWPFDRPDPPIA